MRFKGCKSRTTRTNESSERAGYVYIISNIGSFGENIYKISMTRSLDPQDRIDELGDTSVPFNFDVHAMIVTDDALHHLERIKNTEKIIYLTGEPKGRYVSCRTQKKGAGANGYIQ